jgi:flavin-dependent dehydrogenase
VLTENTDVFIAGGGPAGLAAGIAAAQRGMRVTVADAAQPPIDKACGEGIMPDGLVALGSLGVELTALAGAPFDGIHFLDGHGEASARFPQGSGYGMQRSALHAVLTAKAEGAGVQLAWGTRVEAVRQGEVVAGGKTIRSKYVVCADGQNSPLREMAGLAAGKVLRRRYGFRSHYKLRPWSRFVEVHWANCGQVYVTPVGADVVCVVFITSDPHVRLEDALPWFSAVQARLDGQTPVGKTMGGVTVTRTLKAVTRGGIALLGDASGSADAITGDGLSLAFQQATALADAMRCGDLQEYQRKHKEISRVPRRMGELMLLMDDFPCMRQKVFHGFSRSPKIFERLLAVHTRSISPMQIGAKELLSFGWNVLSA